MAGVIPVHLYCSVLYCTVLLSLYSCSHSPGVRVRWPAARTASSASSVAGHSRGCLAPLTLPVVAVSPAHLSPIPARVGVTCHVSHCPAPCTWVLPPDRLLRGLGLRDQPDLPGVPRHPGRVVPAGGVHPALAADTNPSPHHHLHTIYTLSTLYTLHTIYTLSTHCTVGQSPKGMVYFLELAIVRVAGC